MSPKVSRPVSNDLVEETKNIEKPIKDIKLEKEKAKVQEQSATDDFDEQEIDIRPDKFITLVNLCGGELHLSTLPGGKGKTVNFQSFKDKRRVQYSVLVDIMDVLPSFLEKGYYYIEDKLVIKKHGLQDIYEKILTKDVIESLFLSSMTESDAAELYKSANPDQQGLIIDLIVHRVSGGTEMDMNIINKIANISKVNILEKIEDAKFYSKPDAEEVA
jgi:hypothetical protein